jgi:hypothetical protein
VSNYRDVIRRSHVLTLTACLWFPKTGSKGMNTCNAAVTFRPLAGARGDRPVGGRVVDGSARSRNAGRWSGASARRYGTAETGFYRDPTSHLGTYLEALPRTLSAQVASAWLGVNVTAVEPASHVLQVVLIGAAGLLLVATSWTAVRHPTRATTFGGSWLACGSVLALLPLAATEPARRLLGFAALGTSGAVGVLLEEGLRRSRAPFRPSLVVGLAAAAGVIHLLVAPVQTQRLSSDEIEDQIRNLTRFTTVPQRARSVDTALVVSTTYGLIALSAPFVLRADAPKDWLVLSHTFEQTAAIRTSVSSVDFVQENTALFRLGATGLVRTEPFKVGDTVETAALRAEMLRVDQAGRPLAVHHEFSRNLDSSDVAWISEDRSGFSDVVPPPVGTKTFSPLKHSPQQ